jgi:hypothetical protein
VLDPLVFVPIVQLVVAAFAMTINDLQAAEQDLLHGGDDLINLNLGLIGVDEGAKLIGIPEAAALVVGLTDELHPESIGSIR